MDRQLLLKALVEPLCCLAGLTARTHAVAARSFENVDLSAVVAGEGQGAGFRGAAGTDCGDGLAMLFSKF